MNVQKAFHDSTNQSWDALAEVGVLSSTASHRMAASSPGTPTVKGHRHPEKGGYMQE